MLLVLLVLLVLPVGTLLIVFPMLPVGALAFRGIELVEVVSDCVADVVGDGGAVGHQLLGHGLGAAVLLVLPVLLVNTSVTIVTSVTSVTSYTWVRHTSTDSMDFWSTRWLKTLGSSIWR